MIYVPGEHQTIGAKFLIETPRCQLWADMGLGKTAITLAVIQMLKMMGSSAFPALIIAPKRVARTVWSGEIEKWDCFQDLKLTKILGDAPTRLTALQRRRTDLYVVNYDNLPWLTAQLAGRWPFRTVVPDESTRLKGFRLSHSAVRAGQLAKVAKFTERWMNLTGTLIPNGYTDLWGPYWFVDFGKRLMRTHGAFMQRWFFENQYTKEIRMAPGADKEMMEAIADVTLALRAEDWLDVLKPQMIPIEVELPEKARKQYRQMEKDFFLEIGDGGIEAATAVVKSMKLTQLAGGFIYDEGRAAHWIHDAKIDALKELVEDLHETLLVAYWFKADVPRILKALPGARVLDTEKDINDWNAGKVEVMLVHPQSAGHGLNLAEGGRNIAFFTQTWDLELRQQVIERIGAARQAQLGRKKVVRVFDIKAKNTIDDWMLERIESKRSVQDALQLARSKR